MDNFEVLVKNQTIHLSDDKRRLKFCNSFKIDKLIIPAYVDTIEDYAFESCEIGKLILSPGAKQIWENAFSFSYVTEVVIPKTVEYIGDCAFENNYSLEKICLDRNDAIYFAEEAVLKEEGILEIYEEPTLDNLLNKGKTLKEINQIMQEER